MQNYLWKFFSINLYINHYISTYDIFENFRGSKYNKSVRIPLGIPVKLITLLIKGLTAQSGSRKHIAPWVI